MNTSASWVIMERGTDRVMFETFDRRQAEAASAAGHKAVPIREYLANLNKKAKEA